jgi:hypothetical protein
MRSCHYEDKTRMCAESRHFYSKWEQFLLAIPIGPTLMPTQYHVLWLPVTFSSVVKRPLYTAQYSYTCSADVTKPYVKTYVALENFNQPHPLRIPGSFYSVFI